MENVSIILTTRQCTGNNEVEVIIECEKKYNALALCCCSGDIIDLAKAYEGKMMPWTKEPQQQKFCHVFRFETEDMKREFLKKLLESS